MDVSSDDNEIMISAKIIKAQWHTYNSIFKYHCLYSLKRDIAVMRRRLRDPAHTLIKRHDNEHLCYI